MRRKRWSYLIACVVLAGGLAAPGTYTKVYAQDYENVEYVTSVSELRDSMDEADVVNSADVMDRGADVDATAMYSSESADIYSLRRIILYTDEVPETYGATTVICYDKYDYYVLGYDTEEATKQAYEKLQEEYEPDKCMLDQVIYSEDVLADSDLDSNSYAAQRNVDAMLAASETYKAVSWGTRYMGMDRLKATDAANPEALKVDATGLSDFVEQQARDQIARKHKEDRDAEQAALSPREAEVIEHHCDDGKRAQAVEGGDIARFGARGRLFFCGAVGAVTLVGGHAMRACGAARLGGLSVSTRTFVRRSLIARVA